MKSIPLYALILGFCANTFAQNIVSDMPDDDIPTGAIRGVFSVSKTSKVYFSKGNLQFCKEKGTHLTADGVRRKGTWRFAENQYDYLGTEGDDCKVKRSADGYFDSFGWATSGYNNTKKDKKAVHFQPWSPCFFVKTRKVPVQRGNITEYVESKVYNNEGFGPTLSEGVNSNLTYNNRFYDWGIYNAISNGGDQPGLWRTLSTEEFEYVIWHRPNATKLISFGFVNNQMGLILLPDDWVKPDSIQFSSFNDAKYVTERIDKLVDPNSVTIYFHNAKAHFNDTNSYSVEQWKVFESLGCVFLPIEYYPNYYYWASTCKSSDYAYVGFRIYTMGFTYERIYDSNETKIIKDASDYTLVFDRTCILEKTIKSPVRLVTDCK